MKQFSKYILVFMAGAISMLLLMIVALFVYINWEGPKTEEQEESLDMIQQQQGPAQPGNTTEVLPDVEPDIYDDRHLDEEGENEGEPPAGDNPDDVSDPEGSFYDHTDVDPNVYADEEE